MTDRAVRFASAFSSVYALMRMGAYLGDQWVDAAKVVSTFPVSRFPARSWRSGRTASRAVVSRSSRVDVPHRSSPWPVAVG